MLDFDVDEHDLCSIKILGSGYKVQNSLEEVGIKTMQINEALTTDAADEFLKNTDLALIIVGNENTIPAITGYILERCDSLGIPAIIIADDYKSYSAYPPAKNKNKRATIIEKDMNQYPKIINCLVNEVLEVCLSNGFDFADIINTISNMEAGCINISLFNDHSNNYNNILNELINFQDKAIKLNEAQFATIIINQGSKPEFTDKLMGDILKNLPANTDISIWSSSELPGCGLIIGKRKF